MYENMIDKVMALADHHLIGKLFSDDIPAGLKCEFIVPGL